MGSTARALLNIPRSYGLNGKLAKAPGYQDLPTFDKTRNGLFPIHVKVDSKGFVWINMDGSDKPEIAWTETSDEAQIAGKVEGSDLSQFEFDHTWEDTGEYNWKLLADKADENDQTGRTHSDTAPVLISAFAYPNATLSIT
jgi:phenylpropionate dioxygenase-like ring-hydroxylating dioxygenase large terminal subunit